MSARARDVVLHEFAILENSDLIAITMLGDHHRLAGRSFEDRQRLDPAAT
jgi:hypothetical protein